MMTAILYSAASFTESSNGKKASLARIAPLVYFSACSSAILVDLTREVCPQPIPLVIGKFLSTIMTVLDLILAINFQAILICFNCLDVGLALVTTFHSLEFVSEVSSQS